jgi:hypothetical protein
MVDLGKGREAEKRRQVCTAMFRWALSQDIVEADPTAELEAYDHGAPRDRVLTIEEIAILWEWLESDALSAEAADILKLELLTGARCGEISGLRAEEIDRQKWIWTLPAGRSKNGRQRATPIVGLAREILEARFSALEKGPLFVIETGAVLTSAHIGHYLITRGARLPIAKFNSHDLRRTFATMLAEMGIALDLVAAIVGHESGGKDTRTLVRYYVRTDLLERKAHALKVWDERLREIVAGEQAAKVLRLPRRQCAKRTGGTCSAGLCSLRIAIARSGSPRHAPRVVVRASNQMAYIPDCDTLAEAQARRRRYRASSRRAIDCGGRPLKMPAASRSSRPIGGVMWPASRKSMTLTGAGDRAWMAVSSSAENTDRRAVIITSSSAVSLSRHCSTMPTVVSDCDASSRRSRDT